MSPKISIPKSVMTAVEQKRGLYADKPIRSNQVVKQVNYIFKTKISDVIHEAFIEYAKAHGCKTEQLEIEWNRFYKFLKDKL